MTDRPEHPTFSQTPLGKSTTKPGKSTSSRIGEWCIMGFQALLVDKLADGQVKRIEMQRK